MATKTPEAFYRVVGIPAAVEVELRAAAEAGGIPVKVAFLHVVRGLDLGEAIFFGQARAIRDGVPKETVSLGVHLPREDKERIREAAELTGVTIAAAGRLILLSRAGVIAETIRESLGAHLTGAAESR